MFRGFENTGSRKRADFMFAVLGGDDPGRVTWSPDVFTLAEQHGLVLLEGGRLIDRAAGAEVPAGARLQRPPTEAAIRRLATPSPERMQGCVARFGDLRANPESPLTAPGVADCPVIIGPGDADGFPPGPITGWWRHGFSLRCLKLQSGAAVAPHMRDVPEVVLMHAGTLEVRTPAGVALLGAGDSLSIPKGVRRAFRATSSDGCVAYLVRGEAS